MATETVSKHAAQGRGVARHRPGGVVIPAGPHDWGLFGPSSVSWRVHDSAVMLAGGLRALLIQSFNPLPMAGIAQHSDYLTRPLLRLRHTAEYVATIVYADTASAERTAAIVGKMHRRVKGTDPITGRRYDARDPEQMLWVHCVEAHSFLAAYRSYGGRISEADQDAYLAEQVVAAELIGIPREMVPASRAAYRDYFESVRDQLCVSPASRDVIDLVLAPPLTRELLPHQGTLRMMATAAVAITPRYMRRMAGIERATVTYAGAAAGTRVAGKLLRAPPLRRFGATLVGPRTVSLPRAAIAAASAAG